MPIRLVLADDHPLMLQGLRNFFHQQGDFQVVACCRDGEEALHAVRQHRPDVLILDISMPKKDGLVVLQEIRQEQLPTRVVILTAFLNEDEVMQAMRLGVGGVVLKEMASQLLLQCVRKVHAGDRWLEKYSVGRALEKMLRREAGTRELARMLTPRELEIVHLVAGGLRNKEIAEKLCITEGTVKIHLHKIYTKLDVDGRIELVRCAHDKGLI